MVTRNLSFQDISYSKLLQVPDDREFLNLEELKPHQLTELGIATDQIPATNRIDTSNLTSDTQSSDYCRATDQIYYDLNVPQQIENDNCSLYIGNIARTCPTEDSIKTSSLEDDQKYQCQAMQPPDHSPNCTGGSRKRKNYNTQIFQSETSSSRNGSDLEDNTSDDARSVKINDEIKKQNHSEIEKRRRDKMNTYITELSNIIPMCNTKSKKLDKLTVLRMAVQHMKIVRGALHSYTEGDYKPSFLSDQELKMLILQGAEGFLFVVGCDRGRILYVSESVSQVLHYKQDDLLGQNWFDILHPKDVAKVKEQLSSSDIGPRERLIDSKTMLPVDMGDSQGLDRLCPGARRSFFCRMKCKIPPHVKDEDSGSTGSNRRGKHCTDKRYSVIQCTGYLKSWAPAKTNFDDQETDNENESYNLSCLVAIGRIPVNIFNQPGSSFSSTFPNTSSIQFNSRHALDGQFIFVDQRATLVLGFLPQELLGTSMYEYYQRDDIPAMAESHKIVLQSTKTISTPIYRFRTKNEEFIQLQSKWKSFKNPWTEDVEYMVAKNIVIFGEATEGNNFEADINQIQMPGNIDFFNHSNGREIHQKINAQVETSKIGRKIAEQVFDYQRKMDDSSPDNNSLDSSGDKLTGGNSQFISSGENSGSAFDTRYGKFALSPFSQPESAASTSTGKSYRNSVMVSPDPGSDSEIIRMMSNSAIPEQQQPQPQSQPQPQPQAQQQQQNLANATRATEGQDEAAMAVIMSLLEADAGLGGPVDFTGLPWPLP